MSRRGAAPLDVWLYGRRLARVSARSSVHYQLKFSDEALNTYGEGRRILSLALPVSSRAYRDTAGGRLPVRHFLDGLLPEGNLRTQLARTQRVSPHDLMPLLASVGGDCAGAVQFLRADAPRPRPRVRELTPRQLSQMVADLPTFHLPEGAVMQASLAGVQDKVLVTDLGGGRWGLPEGGAASTHIIKPEPLHGALPNLVVAEDWALRVAARAGLPAARSRLERFDGRRAIVLERYDRDAAGARIHQEDFCQALGLGVDDKYEAEAEARAIGSRLSRVVGAAAGQAEDPMAFRTSLLSAVTYNVVVGNGDAHSKNYSVLIGEHGEVSLAPLYDVAPVMYMNPIYRSTGHVINGQTRIGSVDADDLVAEAQSWGMPAELARRTVEETVDRTREAIADTEVPDELAEMRENLDAALAQRWPGRPPADGAAPERPADTAAGQLDSASGEAGRCGAPRKADGLPCRRRVGDHGCPYHPPVENGGS